MVNLIIHVKNSIDGIGNKSAISISKTRNRTAKIKNRKENGIRAELCGSKPHSKGVVFSKFNNIFLFKKNVAVIIRTGKKAAITKAIIIISMFLGVILCL